jgi:hypothetical protein
MLMPRAAGLRLVAKSAGNGAAHLASPSPSAVRRTTSLVKQGTETLIPGPLTSDPVRLADY